MKILLIRPKYPNYFDDYSPTNLAILGAIAVDLGHDVKIVDLNVDHFPDSERFDIIGITGISKLIKKTIRHPIMMLKKLRRAL